MTKKNEEEIEEKNEVSEAYEGEVSGEEKPVSSRRGLVLVFVGILLLMSFLSGAALQSFGGSFFETGQIFSPAVSSLVQGRLSQLEARMADMEEKVKVLKVIQGQKGEEKDAKVITKIEPSIKPEQLEKIEKAPFMVLAFLEMERKALSGKVFEEDRQRLRHFAGEDTNLIELLLGLEKEALTGVPSLKTLRELWHAQARTAQKALRDAAAKTWQDRLVVALESLVSVHSVQADVEESFSMSAVDLDLADGDINAALLKADAMPENVVSAIQDWRAKAKERLAVETKLSKIEKYLIEGEKEEKTDVVPKAAVEKSPETEKESTP